MTRFKTAHLPQGTIQYVEQGQGQPIVFVHGLLVDHQIWAPLVPRLSQGLRCILPNWPLGAHAVPMKPEADLSVPGMVQVIADFLVALNLRDVILVGNDSGGALTQMVCARFPERIDRVVLTTCDAYDVFPPWPFLYLKWLGMVPGLPWLSARLIHHVPLLRRLPITYGALTDGPLDNALIDQWVAPLLHQAGVRSDLAKFVRTLSSRHTEAAGKALQRFDKPVLLLWSTRCPYFPKRLAERLQRELPQAELRWINSAGVFVGLEYADQVAEGIWGFRARDQARALP